MLPGVDNLRVYNYYMKNKLFIGVLVFAVISLIAAGCGNTAPDLHRPDSSNAQ